MNPRPSYRISLSTVFSALMLLPRSSFAYAAYCLTPVLMCLSLRSVVFSIIVTIVLVVQYLLASSFWYLSPGAFAIELALTLPFFLAMSGFQLSWGVAPIAVMRRLNLFIMILSVLSFIDNGFPARLPYVDFLPDEYHAAFGLGGAKIVTIVGFFGLIFELNKSRTLSVWFFIAALNFLAPSYVLGIMVGIISLAIFLFRDFRLLLLAIVIAAAIFPYVLFRFESLNSEFISSLGMHPKLYQFLNVLHIWREHFPDFLTGAGLGQFTGEAAQWSSPSPEVFSSARIPNVPGMFAGEPHLFLHHNLISYFTDSRFSLESSANKPFSSITTLIVEIGFIQTVLIFGYFILITVRRHGWRVFSTGILAFVFFVCLVDSWHNSPWFALCLICFNSLSRKDSDVS